MAYKIPSTQVLRSIKRALCQPKRSSFVRCPSKDMILVRKLESAGEMGHRKRVRYYDEPGHCHELTFSCYRRLPLLTNHVWRAMLGVSVVRAVAGRVPG